MTTYFWDFEFSTGVTEFQMDNRIQTGQQPKPNCMAWRSDDGRSGKVWLLNEDTSSVLAFKPLPTDTLVGFYVSAEFGCHNVLGWSVDCHIVDLFAEHRVLTNGLGVDNNLLDVCDHWKVEHEVEPEHKKQMQRVSALGGPFSDADKQALMDYCMEDVILTEKLYYAMKSEFQPPQFVDIRGEYMRCVANIESRGIPIDMENLEKFKWHWEDIKLALIEEVDKDYHVYAGGKFKMALFEEYLKLHPEIRWPRTPTGKPSLEDDTFKEMSKRHPCIMNLKELRATLGKLRLNKLAVGPDGRNRCMLSPFRSKTGRNQPSSAAFLFGPSRWIRSLAKPTEGMSLAYLDYKSQEFAIAAYLSQDQNMIAAYESGDPYMATAIAMNLAPEGATKEKNPEARAIGKILVLGIGYGSGAPNIASMLNKPTAYATELIRKHKRIYRTYWKWQEQHMDDVLLSRKCQSALGWQIQVVMDAEKPRTLGNWPMQAGGSEILRAAVIMLEKAGIRVVATVHDAVLLELPTSDIQMVIPQAKEIMMRASRLVTKSGNVLVDDEIYSYPNRYVAEGGEDMWNRVQKILEDLK